MTLKKAAIDIGSNTTLLLVGQKDSSGKIEWLHDESIVTGLGRGVKDNKLFCEEAMDDTFEALKKYADTLKAFNVEGSDVRVTSTEAARIAQNASVFFQKIEQELGLSVEVISAEQEAYYTALGVTKFETSALQEKVILDIGGASTELIKVQSSPFKILDTISYPIGSVLSTEFMVGGHFPDELEKRVGRDSLGRFKTKSLVCVAGSMTALAGMIQNLEHFEAQLIDGSVILYRDFEKFVKELERLTPEQLKTKYPFLGKRALTIQAGAQLALEMCARLEVQELRISTFGLRHGTFYEAMNG